MTQLLGVLMLTFVVLICGDSGAAIRCATGENATPHATRSCKVQGRRAERPPRRNINIGWAPKGRWLPGLTSPEFSRPRGQEAVLFDLRTQASGRSTGGDHTAQAVVTLDSDWLELVDTVNMQKNRLLMVNGYSPIQRVIGYSPKLPGGLMSQGQDCQATPEHIRIGDIAVKKAIYGQRKAAAHAFIETDCTESLRRALTSGPRPMLDYQVGQLAYFRRIGVTRPRRSRHQHIGMDQRG